MRDDFSQRTKDLLANRVGWKCSNPNCRKATRGAGIGKENIINIGVASHITAASKGGPRYDENITSQERASAENGIWLCQSCSKLIDSDVNRYTIAKLKKWKEISEQMAVLDLEEATAEEQHEDKELIKFFVQCFDRPAFQDRIYQEGRMEDFDKAIEDTIIALNVLFFWQKPGGVNEGISGIQIFLLYFIAMFGTIWFWSICTVILCTLLRNMWAGIGCLFGIVIGLISKAGSSFFGNLGLFSFSFCEPTQLMSESWIYGTLVSFIAGLFLFAVLPMTLKKRG